jgi:hypothetical protein
MPALEVDSYLRYQAGQWLSSPFVVVSTILATTAPFGCGPVLEGRMGARLSYA